MYSIDKIKILIHGIKNPIIQNLLNKLTNVLDKDLIYYKSNAVVKCYDNFMYRGIYVGFSNNWNRNFSNRYTNVVLEWNPNKISLEEFPVDLRILFDDLRRIEIMSCDVCKDIEIPITDLIVLKHHESQRMNILSHNTIETIYVGQFNENGFCRIYNKAKELKIEGDLTRIEVHITHIGFIGYEEVDFKPITILKVDENIDLNDTQKVLIIACYNMPYLLQLLEARRRRQIKQLMKNNLEQVDISIEEIKECIKNFKFMEGI